MFTNLQQRLAHVLFVISFLAYEKYQYLITNLKTANIEFIKMCCLMLWDSQQDLNLID